MSAPRRAIGFDLDGTLVDSLPSIHAAANAVLREFGLRALTLDQARGFIGGGVDMLWQKIMRAQNVDPSGHRELVAAFMRRYHLVTHKTRLFPGVLDALGALASDGCVLGICTNKPMGPAQAVLDHCGIAHLFPVVVAGDSLSVRKPDPEPILSMFQGLGGLSPTAIFIGDSEFDAIGAQNAGVAFGLFTRGYRQARIDDLAHDFAFDSFAALPGLIAARSAA